LLATDGTLCMSIPMDRFMSLLLLAPPPLSAACAWTAYQRRVTRPLTLDRVIWLGVDEAVRRRLPAARLRRLLDATPDAALDAALRQHWPQLAAAGMTSAEVRALATPVFGPFENAVTAFGVAMATPSLAAHIAAVTAAVGLEAALPPAPSPGLIYRTCMWRVVVAHWLTGASGGGTAAVAASTPLLAAQPIPSSLPESEYPVAYLGTLFADTHLDLRCMAARYARVDDAFFLENGGACLTQVYPLPHRVVCAEEVVDFASLLTKAELGYDTGWGKQTYNMEMLLAYLFERKATNSICHVRRCVLAPPPPH
jgi:hypothetical protein